MPYLETLGELTDQAPWMGLEVLEGPTYRKPLSQPYRLSFKLSHSSASNLEEGSVRKELWGPGLGSQPSFSSSTPSHLKLSWEGIKANSGRLCEYESKKEGARLGLKLKAKPLREV